MQFDKIAITGHTRGIGKGLYDFYSTDKNALGYSKSTGHDIGDENIIETIIKETVDCEVFINNAFSGYAQSRIATLWFMEHKDKNHLLVNISSIAVIANEYVPEQNVYKKYGDAKKDLDKISWDINFSNKPARCINISPALIDTDMAHPGYYKRFKAEDKLITVPEMTKIISDLIEQFNQRWYVPHLYLINNTNFD